MCHFEKFSENLGASNFKFSIKFFTFIVFLSGFAWQNVSKQEHLIDTHPTVIHIQINRCRNH